MGPCPGSGMRSVSLGRLQRGNHSIVSSEHHIVGNPRKGHAGGDAADARSSRQSAARICSGGVPPYRTRIRRVLEILPALTHAIAARPVSGCAHMVCTIAPPPVGAPSVLMRKESASFWSGSACAAGNRDYRCSLQPTRSRLACLRSSTSACEPMPL